MVMTTNSSVWRGWVIVDLTEGEPIFLETVRAICRGGIAQGSIRARLDGRKIEQLCWDCTKLPWKNLDKRMGAKEISQSYAGTS